MAESSVQRIFGTPTGRKMLMAKGGIAIFLLLAGFASICISGSNNVAARDTFLSARAVVRLAKNGRELAAATVVLADGDKLAIVSSGRESGESRQIALSEVLSISFRGRKTVLPKLGVRVFSRTGEIFFGTPRAPEEGVEELFLVCDILGEISIPFADIRELKVIDNNLPEKLRDNPDGTPENDVLYAKDGNLYEGIVVALGESGNSSAVKMHTADFGEVTLPYEKIRRIEFASFGESTAPELGQTGGPGQAEVRLTDGTMLKGRLSALTENRVTLDGKRAQFPVSRISSIVFAGEGRYKYLSDLRPVSVEYNPYAGDRVPSWLGVYKADVSAIGTPLALSGENTVTEYAKGIGSRAGVRIRFSLPAGYKRFVCAVGVDKAAESSPVTGSISVRFIVSSDKKEVFRSRFLNIGDTAERISLDISDASELTLSTEWSDNGDVSALADWCGAVLLK